MIFCLWLQVNFFMKRCYDFFLVNLTDANGLMDFNASPVSRNVSVFIFFFLSKVLCGIIYEPID